MPFVETLATRCPYIAAEGLLRGVPRPVLGQAPGQPPAAGAGVPRRRGFLDRRATTPASLTGDVDDLFTLHRARFDRFGGRTSFGGERVRRFHHALAARLAARGELALTTLSHAGRPIAAHYAFRVGGKLYHFQGGFDPDAPLSSAGTALTTIVLEDDVFGAGLAEYDFLDGTEAYKLALATGERRLYDVRLYRPTRTGRVTALTRGALQLLRRIGRPAG